jgi:hypothetical protein
MLKVPVAMNCTSPFGESRASAVAGLMLTDVSSRPPPHPIIQRLRVKITSGRRGLLVFVMMIP